MFNFQEPKDPESIIDYVFDWSDWLEEGDSIESHTVTVPAGIVIEDSEEINESKMIRVWLSGGLHNSIYPIRCKITTADGRIEPETGNVKVYTK